MAGADEVAAIGLQRSFFGDKERVVLRYGGLTASLFRYDTGIEAIRLSNERGHLIVLPFMGQMVWSARFDGVDLAMQSRFAQPVPARTIVETYGCLAYHSGILRNGVPGPEDTHTVHGEMPCAAMDEAGLACGTDEAGPWIAVTGERRYAMGFGSHYRANPMVVLRGGDTGLDIVMDVQNVSAAPMDLMYMCHVNFAFVPGGRIVQPVPFDKAHVVARTAIPGFVTPTDDYRALIAELAENPARMQVLNEPDRYDPEQVFYIKGLTRDANGLVRFMLARPEGDGFAIAWDPEVMPHTVRWILANGDHSVAAFALPSTCEPEGYLADKRKGNVRILAPGESASFSTRIDYLDAAAAAVAADQIEGSAA